MLLAHASKCGCEPLSVFACACARVRACVYACIRARTHALVLAVGARACPGTGMGVRARARACGCTRVRERAFHEHSLCARKRWDSSACLCERDCVSGSRVKRRCSFGGLGRHEKRARRGDEHLPERGAPGLGSPPPTSAPSLGSHPPTSAPGLGSPRPHLRRDWACLSRTHAWKRPRRPRTSAIAAPT